MKEYKVTLTIVKTFFDDECNDATDATSHMYDEIAEMTYGEACKHMKVEEIGVAKRMKKKAKDFTDEEVRRFCDKYDCYICPFTVMPDGNGRPICAYWAAQREVETLEELK